MTYRTSSTPRRKFHFGQYVFDSHLDDSGWELELAERNAHVDAGVWGVLWGMAVTQHYTGTFPTPNLTADVAAGAARDDAGWRLPIAAAQNVNCAIDHLGASTAVGVGKHRCVSVFARFEDAYSEIHTTKAGASIYRIHDDSTVLEVWMGAETNVGDPLDYPPLMTGYVLLADITLINAQTQIVPGDISTDRRQDQVVLAGTPHAIRRGWLKAASADLLGWFNDHANGDADKHAVEDVTAALVTQTPYTLPAGTAASQLTQLLTDLNDHQIRCQAHNALQYVTDYSSGDSIPLALQSEDSDPDAMFTPYDSAGKLFAADEPLNIITCVGHGYDNGDTIRFSGTPPSPLVTTAGVYYYVRDKTDDTFKVALTQGGAAIDLLDAGVAGQKVHKAHTKFFFPRQGWYRAHARAEWSGHAAPGGGRGLTLRVTRVSPPGPTTVGQVAVSAVPTANEPTNVDCSAPMFYIAAGSGAYYLEVLGRQTYGAPGPSMAVSDVYLSTWFLGP